MTDTPTENEILAHRSRLVYLEAGISRAEADLAAAREELAKAEALVVHYTVALNEIMNMPKVYRAGHVAKNALDYGGNAVEAGYVIVPEEPTEEMSKAFWAEQLPGEVSMFEWFKAGYAAMIVALKTNEAAGAGT